MSSSNHNQPLRLATLLAAGAIALLGVGLTASTDQNDPRWVLGTTVVADEAPAQLAFGTQEQGEAQIFIDKINALRVERDLDPLTEDPVLTLTATAWATQMSQTEDLEHADDLSLGVASDWRKLGENVGVAPDGQLDELFEAFLASPTHLANLVDPSFDFIGIGVVHADGKLWMTQRFMDVSPVDAGVEVG